MRDELHLLSRRDGAKSDQGALRSELERLVDEVVVAGQVDTVGTCRLDRFADLNETPAVERRLLDRNDLGHLAHALQSLGIEVDATERRLELKEDERQACGVTYRGVHGIILRLGRGGVNGMKRGVQRMPRQNRAFHPRRQIAYPRENRQTPQMVRAFNV